MSDNVVNFPSKQEPVDFLGNVIPLQEPSEVFACQSCGADAWTIMAPPGGTPTEVLCRGCGERYSYVAEAVRPDPA